MSKVRDYLSLIKFSHTVFALPFALIGFFLGRNATKTTASIDTIQIDGLDPMLFKFILVLCCMVFARSAAMAFNRYLDRHYDSLNPRTAIREIPAGVIKPQQALWFTVMASIFFVISCWFINFLCFCLSFVALFVVLFYSYTKRFTALCHVVLGLGLSLAPIGAYLAVTGVFDWVPLMFSFVVLCWVSGFDIIYALQDETFDREQGLHSIPSSVGRKSGVLISRLLHLATAVLVMTAGILGAFHIWYWVGCSIFVGLLVFQHTLFSVNDLSKINLRFMTTNGVASVVFAVFVITDLLLY